MKRLSAIVHGRVQGVAFRNYTQREAARLCVTGWVANQADGTVKVVAEGAEDALQQLAQWLHRGSPAAHVVQVDVQWLAATGEFSRFGIEF